MKKKGIFGDPLGDIFVGLGVLILGFFIWLHIFGQPTAITSGKLHTIQASANLGFLRGSPAVLASYLRTPYSNGDLADKLVRNHLGRLTTAEDDLAQLLENVYKSYDADVCWQLSIDGSTTYDQTTSGTCTNTPKVPPLDAAAIIPIYYNSSKKNIRVHLTVLGYK